MSLPKNAVAAATWPDPYPFYADLVARRPLYRDEALGMWVASSGQAVSAVLSAPACRVRPPTEVVPRALGPSAAAVFRHLVRMDDGPVHCPMKQAVSSFLGALGSLAGRHGADEARRWTRLFSGPGRLHALTFQLPVSVVAGLLGLPPDVLPRVASWTGDFVRGITPGATPERLEAGERAAHGLLEVFRATLASDGGGPLALLARQAEHFGAPSQEAMLANAIGLLSQTHDATAGLLGNTLLALLSRPALLEAVLAKPGLLPSVLDEVLRYDPPVQNTRRFLAEDAVVGGQAMAAGDAVLVVLAAANRDPAFNVDPERFDIERKDRRSFTFGAGVHACPGEALAKALAQGAVEELLTGDLGPLREAARDVAFQPSVNGRIPLFPREARS
ncbi:cytochrome P450 [Pyxidicoccus sp. 3LFB2]